MKTQTLIMVLAAVVFATGCSTLKEQMKMPSLIRNSESEQASPDNQPPNYGSPEKMLTIWKDSIRSVPGQPAKRGFGGRIYLYDANQVPIRAEGEFVVYGFDDSNKNREGSKADRKIVLENSTFQRLYSESPLGDSYSVWIDWDDVGGPDKSVTLVPFFRTPDGKIIRAGQAIYNLRTPGKSEVSKEKLVSYAEEKSDKGTSPIAHANFMQGDGDSNNVALAGGVQELPRKSSVRTTTIRVPKATQKRLRESKFIDSSSKKTAEAMTAETKSTEADSTVEEVRPSRIEEARKKRREKIGNGNAFGMPGQL